MCYEGECVNRDEACYELGAYVCLSVCVWCACVYVCVRAWMCGCATVWLCGCVALWLSQRGCGAVCACGAQP